MKTSRKFMLALTGLAVLCVCAAVAAPLAMGDGAGRGSMAKDGTCREGACADERMQSALQQMAENGIDTTDLETALENGDREAVRAFMQEKRPADAPEGAHMMNGERAQQMIQRMQENGIDTSALETALENGDREAVRAFMQENRPVDAPEGAHMMNGERAQRMVQSMQKNGIDTTDLEAALENGDVEAVRTFMQENGPDDAGTGFRHGGPATE
ncbi:MAG TPA: DUF4258 domain-containing protein [Methanoculleus sp.]|nr:DUF4258 domain-containing protein [Methanoculleus sp.]